jgi:hypothetical protein
LGKFTEKWLDHKWVSCEILKRGIGKKLVGREWRTRNGENE